MKKLLLLSVASLTALAGWSQSKINPAGLQEIYRYKVDAGIIQEPGKQLIKKVTVEPTVSAVVIVPENSSAAQILSGLDVEIISEMNGVAVVSCPITETEKIAALPQVEQVGFGDLLKASMDYARPSGNVTSVQNGFTLSGTNYSFDGTGVVAGMMDTGLEPNHLNFKNSDGTSRIQRLWVMTGSDGKSNMYTSTTVGSVTTENSGQTHATHVAGIMGGGYKGIGTYSQLTKSDYNSSPGLNYVEDGGSVPFYGVATGADLAFNVGELYGQNIVQGVTNVIEYAEEVGKPAVINLSLGSNTGPHDGTDYIPAALARLGTRGIICVSAGNEGEENLYCFKKLGNINTDRYLRTVLANQKVESGQIDIWTGSNTFVPVQVGWVGNDRQFHPLIEVTKAGQTIGSGSSEGYSNLFNGTVSVTSSINAANNRFNVYISLSNVSQKDSGSYLAISVGGDNLGGQKIYVYGNNVEFTNKTSLTGASIAGYSAGSPKGSINDDACGGNIVSVGAYVTRNCFGTISSKTGYRLWEGISIDDIASFSSYGQNYQGQQLPIVAAPGWGIVSSISRYYINAGKASADNMTAKATNGNGTDYWGQMSGTSMACPFAAGTIALWLQAAPSLNYEQVVDVIANTSTYNQLSMGTERWGHGKIDALKGVQYVLQKYAANGAVWEDDEQRLVVTPNGNGYDVTMAGEASFTVTVYDIQGQPVATARGIDGQAAVSTSDLTSGIYVLAAQGASSRLTRKITVR